MAGGLHGELARASGLDVAAVQFQGGTAGRREDHLVVRHAGDLAVGRRELDVLRGIDLRVVSLALQRNLALVRDRRSS